MIRYRLLLFLSVFSLLLALTVAAQPVPSARVSDLKASDGTCSLGLGGGYEPPKRSYVPPPIDVATERTLVWPPGKYGDRKEDQEKQPPTYPNR